jgi:hypothetical protein
MSALRQGNHGRGKELAQQRITATEGVFTKIHISKIYIGPNHPLLPSGIVMYSGSTRTQTGLDHLSKRASAISWTHGRVCGHFVDWLRLLRRRRCLSRDIRCVRVSASCQQKVPLSKSRSSTLYSCSARKVGCRGTSSHQTSLKTSSRD